VEKLRENELVHVIYILC